MRKLIATVFNYSLDGLFDGVPKSYALGLVSPTASKSGIVELQHRRRRE